MLDDPRLVLVEKFFSDTGATYDRVVRYATLGIDSQWKRIILDQIPKGATRILDLAAGTGILTIEIARRFPTAQVIGVELREEYLRVAREKQRKTGLPNLAWCLGRAEDFRSDEPFDCVVSSYLAKYADIPRLATAAKLWLKPTGLFVAHDFMLPPKALLLKIWKAYFWILQHLVGPFMPEWREIFYGLPALILKTQWLKELPEALEPRGFCNIEVKYLTLYGSAIVIATRQGSATEHRVTPTPIK